LVRPVASIAIGCRGSDELGEWLVVVIMVEDLTVAVKILQVEFSSSSKIVVMADGLREHKKRATRQLISDIATAMFIERGFDTVTISEIAAAAEVSEKTVYNYFPTKESLVFDQVDEQLELIVRTVRERPRGVTPTSAVITALQQDQEDFAEAVSTGGVGLFRRFGAMVRDTPALQAAWGEYRYRLVDALTEVLATELTVDPADPEPLIAARALTSLVELQYNSALRHAESDITAEEFQARMAADLARGARLLDTGMWSLHVMVEGRRTKDQIRDAATKAEQARQQVVTALRRAKREWGASREGQAFNAAARKAGHEAQRQAQEAAREAHLQAHSAAREAARQARQQAQATARDAREQALAQAQEAVREAKEQAQAAARDARDQALAAARDARRPGRGPQT
jgi:AcrR family transcriptional regulator